MNRLSFTFVSSLVAACAAESSTTAPSPVRNGVAPTEPAPGVLTQHPSSDPICEPRASAMRQYGTLGEDGFRDVAITPTGEVLVTGFQGGYLPPDGEIIGSRGIVLEYDGTFVPRAVIDTLGTDSVEAITVAPDTGRVWMAVRTNGDLQGLMSYGGFDVVLSELSPVGARMRVRGFDTTPEYPRQIAAGDGVVAIAGHEERLMPDGATWINPNASVFNTSGDQPATQWRLTRRADPVELYTAVDVAGDTIALAGAIATGTEQGAYIAARTRDADLLWQQQLSATGGDAIAAVRIVEDGDVVFAGNDGGDFLVGRLDGSTGTPEWSVQLGDNIHDERAADLAIDRNGRIFVTGDLESSAGAHLDAFLLVLDRDGQPLGHAFWASDGDDIPTGIAVDTCGNVVMVGETTGALAGEPRGGTDGFLIVTSVTDGGI